MAIQARNIANTGDMRAATLALTAREDLRNIGGQLAATGDMSLVAGRDVVMQSTTASGGTVKGNVTTKATVLDQVASLTAGGVMVVQAGRDAQLQAVQITQGGAEGAGAEGGVMVAAGRDLTLSTVQTSSSRDQVWNATNFKKESQRQDVGTEIKAEGAVLLKAGQDLSATAAQIASAQGAVTLSAGRDVELLAGEANKVVEEMTQKTKKSLFKKKTVTTYNKTDTTTAIGTTLSGDTVNIVAGRDITLAAAQAVSDNGTKLIADRDITIDGVTNSVDTEQFKKTVKSGLFSGGGIGVTIGKQELSQATKTSQETHQGSVVASVAGDVDIYAGGKYRQVGSEVQAPQGDVTIKGKSIDIVEARNQSAQDTETKFRQSGLSLSLSAPGVDAAMGAIKAGEHVTQTQDDRMKALAAATAISKAKQAVEEIQKFNDLAKAQQEQSIRISLSVGSQQSKSSQHNEANQAAGSSVLADGKLSLIATGGGQDSNVTVRGSTLAGQDVFIKADNKIDLLAAQNTSEQHSKDSSSSASIGIGISLGQENRLGFTASASVSKGNADGKDTNYSATQVTGGSSVTLQSGGDTTLGGAVVTAPKVVADIGGNLKIESLQDTAKFDSKSQSMGGSVTVGYGAGGSANFSQSKVNADYAAVGEQAGIRAGDGGFQVSVKGNTELKGGAITSSQAAIDAGKNSFSTGTLTSSDIDNRSQFSASAVTVSAGTSGGMAGAFKDSGDERSTTRSTISAGSTTITSGDAASQVTLEKLDRGATNDATAGKLSQGWDGQKLSQQVKVNAQIVAEFGAQASREVAGQLDKKAQQLRAEGKIDEAKKYEEGGEYRVAAHAVIGAITGDLGGALGAAASAKAAKQLDDLEIAVRDKLVEAGLGGEDGKNDWATGLAKLASGALATGIGAAVGAGFDGAAAGLNEDYNNRQLHLTEMKWIKQKQGDFAKVLSKQLERPISEAEAAFYLNAAGEANVDYQYNFSNGNGVRGTSNTQEAQAYDLAKQYILANAKGSYVDGTGKLQKLFVATPDELHNVKVNMDLRNDAEYRDLYWEIRGINLRPDNPTPQELKVYEERQAISLKQTAKDLLTLGVMGLTARGVVKLAENRPSTRPISTNGGQKANEVNLPSEVTKAVEGAIPTELSSPAGAVKANEPSKAPTTTKQFSEAPKQWEATKVGDGVSPIEIQKAVELPELVNSGSGAVSSSGPRLTTGLPPGASSESRPNSVGSQIAEGAAKPPSAVADKPQLTEQIGSVGHVGGSGLAANDGGYGLPRNYTRNEDGSVTGPAGGTYTGTGILDADGNQIYLGANKNYYTLKEDGAQRVESPNEPTRIGASGAVGETELKKLGGVSQKSYDTSMGKRFVDQVDPSNVGHESKVGYTSLTEDIKVQIKKDVEILAGKDLKDVVWHFYKSPVTGQVGASKDLLDELTKSGIKYIIHSP
ncbi:hemagglutinin repeat-containing protein [Roseateles sp.]|uniref:hemagglutinin repeat-containing protein n=1 Tax=Roseateles sp. TaxID=1971397 RepID=UPI0031D83E35